MNKFLHRIIVLFTVFTISQSFDVVNAQQKAQAKQVSKTQTKNRRAVIQKLLREFYDGSKFPGAVVGVSFADGSSLAVAIGYADRNTKTPMLESDLLHAGGQANRHLYCQEQ